MNNLNGQQSLVWAHVGDLHITTAQEPNYVHFLSIVDTLNTRLTRQLDFCVLPGDNADDGSTEQYALIRRGLERLTVPVHVIPGDHDRKSGTLEAFYQELGVPPLPNALTLAGHRCLFLDVVSHGSGGPDFGLGAEQLKWLESELSCAAAHRQSNVVFMHAYPKDLRRDGETPNRLLKRYRVRLVDMGHMHYMSSPMDIHSPTHVVSGEFTVSARIFGAAQVRCRCKIDGGAWNSMREVADSKWEWLVQAPERQFTLTVEVRDPSGRSDTDTICVATTGFQPPDRVADGSDADALEAWPARHLLGTRLGPNRNGRQW